jgi:hypothetical protein
VPKNNWLFSVSYSVIYYLRKILTFYLFLVTDSDECTALNKEERIEDLEEEKAQYDR